MGVRSPSYQAGFYAPERGGLAAYPQLSRGCVGALNPGLGPSGLVLRDWSGRKNHGVLENGPVWSTSTGHRSMLFSGGGAGRVVIAETLYQRVGFSCWVYPITLSPQRGICTAGPLLNHPSFGISLTVSGTLQVFRGVHTHSTATILAGVWSHIMVWSDGATTSFFINGKHSNTVADLIDKSQQSQFYIGNNYWGAFNGYITDVRLYRDDPRHLVSLLARRPGIAYELAPRKFISLPPSSARLRRILTGAT